MGGDAYNQVRCVVYDGNSGSAGRLATMGSTINAVVRGDSVTGINRLYKGHVDPDEPPATARRLLSPGSQVAR